MSLKEKLSKIQTKLKVPKKQYNSFGMFNYRSCEDILEAVKPLVSKEKCMLRVTDEIVNVGDRYYIKASAILSDIESDEEIINTAYARESRDKKGQDESQITGSCSSYARKYALNGLFCIDDVRDADTMDNSAKASEKQIAYLASLYKGDNLKKLLETNGIKKLEDLSSVKASELIAKIKGAK